VRKETRATGETDPERSARWLPLLIGFLLCLLVFARWKTLDLQERTELQNKVNAQTGYLASHIEADLRNRIPTLRRMARAWELRSGISKEEFAGEAGAYLSDVPGFQALEWVDKDSIIRWVVPLEGNEKAVGLNLSSEKTRRTALEKARIGRAPSMTAPIDLVQGGKGFLSFFPIYARGEPEGFILAVFRIPEWLDYVFSIKTTRKLAEECRVAVLFDGVPVYTQPGWDDLCEQSFTAAQNLSIMDHDLLVKVRPTKAFIDANRTPLSTFIAVFGCLFAFLAAFIVRLYQKASFEAWRVNAARKALEKEILEREKIERELKGILVRTDLATKAARMGIWTWDTATNKLTWNERMFELFDVPPDIAPTYDTWRAALHPHDVGRTEALLQNALLGKATFDTEFRIVRADGEIRTVRSAARVVRDSAGKPEYVTGLNWDITENKQAEAALKKSEEQVRLLLNSTGEAIYGIDMDGNCTFANPSCARMLGYPTADELLGKNMHRLIHHTTADGRPMPTEDCRIYQAFRIGQAAHVDDEVLWKADGRSFPVEYWSHPQISGGEVLGAVVTFIDISERRTAEETIRHMATHDALTDLPTIRLYRDRLAMAMNAARRNKTLAAVLFVDLDRFKAVNDTQGHDAGDEVLKEMGKRLRAAVRETDTVARIGGDEFLLAITDMQVPDNAARIAENVINLAAQPVVYRSRKLTVGASVGIALFPRDGETVDALIKNADKAMYAIKKGGRNGYSFYAPAAENESAKD
jgi:diguanylate cyclase (GGDEF)-like protein/PAS domain S-box-containing protein